MRYLIEVLLRTNFGDANLDGIFDSQDLVLIFQAGEYEDGTPGNSTWATGDWNCDGEFGTQDLVAAFQAGAYVAAARPMAATPGGRRRHRPLLGSPSGAVGANPDARQPRRAATTAARRAAVPVSPVGDPAIRRKSVRAGGTRSGPTIVRTADCRSRRRLSPTWDGEVANRADVESGRRPIDASASDRRFARLIDAIPVRLTPAVASLSHRIGT